MSAHRGSDTISSSSSSSLESGSYKDTHGIKNKHIDIYNKYAGEYDKFMSKQDYQHNILPAIESIFPLEGSSNKVAIELGAGTGRIARLLASHFNLFILLDNSQAMLNQARETIEEHKLQSTCIPVCSDFRYIPIRDSFVDLVIAPWSLSYLKVNYEQTWKLELSKVFSEVRRVARQTNEAMLIIVETLGTGYSEPRRTGSWYYKYLNELGFNFKWIRTDYYFENTEEAVEQMRFFFGRVVANRVTSERMSTVPECTGIWWICIKDLIINDDNVVTYLRFPFTNITFYYNLSSVLSVIELFPPSIKSNWIFYCTTKCYC